MRVNTNKEIIEGYIYQHSLKIKKVERSDSPNFGKEFISGELEIATDEECLNVLPVHFTYVTETTKSGAKNGTYAALKRIIDSGKTVIVDGVENAMKVKCQPSIALNDFYPQNQEELVSTPRNEGGFVTIITNFENSDPTKRSKFTTDILINKVTHVDADPEKNISEDFVRVGGAIFNFRNDILPITFTVRAKGAMDYFENLGVTGANPVYTQVWGRIVCSTIAVEKVTESAFGEDAVEMTSRKLKEYVITGARKEPYEYGTPETITEDDIKKAIQDRNVMLAEVKKRSEEYYANKNGNVSFENNNVNTSVPAGGFQF